MSTDKEPEESPSESITGLPEAAIAKALQFNVHHNEIKVNEEDIETDDEAEQVDEEATREQELPKAQKQSPVQTSDVTSPQESNVTDVQPISQTKQGFDPTDSRNKQVALSSITTHNHDNHTGHDGFTFKAHSRGESEPKEKVTNSILNDPAARIVMDISTGAEQAVERTINNSQETTQPSSMPTPSRTPQVPKRDRSLSDEDTATTISREAKRRRTRIQASPGSDTSTSSAKSNIVLKSSKSFFKSHKSSNDWTGQVNKEKHTGDEHSDREEAGLTIGIHTLRAEKPRPKPSKVSLEARTSLQKAQAAYPLLPPSTNKHHVVITSSTVPDRQGLMKFLNERCKVQEQVNDETDILCVGKVSTTSKLLSAVVNGITIVSDRWITQSAKEGKMLDPDDFLIRDDDFKIQYGRYLADVPSCAATDLFSNRLIYISPAVKKIYGTGYGDIRNICIAAGARDVISQPARQLLKNGEDAAVIGLDQGDLDAIALHDNGHKIFVKDFLSHSILSGKVRWDETFMVTPGVAKGRRRHSARAKI